MLPDSFFQDILDRKEKVIVAKHLLRRIGILKPALSLVDKINYFKGYPDLEFLYKVLKLYFMEFGTLPEIDVLMLEMDNMNRMSTSPFDPTMLGTFRKTLESWYASTDWSDDYVKTVIQDYTKIFARDNLLSSVSENDDIEEIQKLIQNAERSFSSDIFDSLSIETAWTDIAGSMKVLQKERTGLSFIDSVLDGGLAETEALLLVAPSGGGKTTIGMQCAAAQVAKGQHVVYLSTEQRLEGDMAIRQFVLGSGFPRSAFMKGYESLPQDIITKLDSVKDQWLEFFHFIDCRKSTRTITSIEDIFPPIDALIDAGKRPSLIILDWWGRLRSRMIMQQQRMSDSRFRHASAEWMDTFLDGVRERKSRSIVLHQVSGAAAQKGPDSLLTTHDAQEDKNLNNLFEFGIALSKMNSDSEAKINCDKARSAARTTGVLKLMGQHCKFVSVGPADVDPLDMQDIGNAGTITQNEYLEEGMVF